MLLARRWAGCNGSAEFISALNPRTNNSDSAFNAPRFAEFRAFRQKRAANASLSRILLRAFALRLVHTTNIQDVRPIVDRQAFGVAGSGPDFTPFTISTATLSATGLAVLSVPGTGAG
jgi:hypothetical protein